MRTHAGYRPPDKCLLFDSKWSSFLKPTDGPLIDETFYGPEIGLNSEELNAIGVIGDVKIGCSLMASHLYLHSKSSTIVRIYRCLNKNDWKPENKATKRIWIPKAVDNGEWVSPEQRVNHDMGDLFGSRLHVLKNYHDRVAILFLLCYGCQKHALT